MIGAQEPSLFSREWYAQFSGPYSQPVEPFRIVSNIYYVGAPNIASYLIATPQGHILIDSGTTEMHDAIISSVEQLGYQVSDIRILLASHAHFDHIEGHALMQRRTGAQVMAMSATPRRLKAGTTRRRSARIGWEPVRVSRRLKDGDTVTLGGTTLRAIHAPGHTQGATIWMTTVEDAGRRYNVAFLTTTTPNPGVPLLNNPRHKNVIEETRSTFRKLKAERGARHRPRGPSAGDVRGNDGADAKGRTASSAAERRRRVDAAAGDGRGRLRTACGTRPGSTLTRRCAGRLNVTSRPWSARHRQAPDSAGVRVLQFGRQQRRREVLVGDRPREAIDGRGAHRGRA